MKIQKVMPGIDNMISYQYADIKNTFYENVIKGFMKDAKPSANPTLLQVSGIPGAGKSTYASKIKTSKDVLIGFDYIMESIPQYREDVSKIGSVEAFKRWEMPARVVGYELLSRCLNKKLDIILEHSGVNEPHVELFKNSKKMGYNTEVVFLMCDFEKAKQRCLQREKVTKRHVPEQLIADRFVLVDKYKSIYATIADKVLELQG